MIDAHVHVWRIGRHGCVWPTAALPTLHRDFTLDDLHAAIAGTGITRVMLVQSQEDAADTAWLLDLARADERVAGVVGWVDLLAPDAEAQVTALAADPALRAIRPMVQDRAATWYDEPALDRPLAAMARAGLVLDALVRPRHLPALHRLARRQPALRIVIDHAAKPDPTALADWLAGIAPLAHLPSVACKLSGLVTELPDALLDDIVARLWSLFGAERLLWGSDWPVLTLADDYRGWLDRARTRVPAPAHAGVFGGNAAHVYGIAA